MTEGTAATRAAAASQPSAATMPAVMQDKRESVFISTTARGESLKITVDIMKQLHIVVKHKDGFSIVPTLTQSSGSLSLIIANQYSK